MADTQQGDVYLFQTRNGGDINVTDGITQMSGGLATSLYLAMFGGNEDDSGGDGDNNQYWGNHLEMDDNSKVRSETQHILQSLPATSFNLRKVEEAVKRDANYLLSINAATSIDVTATIPALNWVKIVVSVTADGKTEDIEFTENWGNQP